MRTCANNNCDTSLDGMKATARYCSAACRVAGWRQREGVTGYKAVRASQYARRKPSGVQVSYRKGLGQMAAVFRAYGEDYDESFRRAEKMLRPVLSDRQRKSLEQREPVA